MAEENKKKDSPIKKFFGEFKTFITRGNVLDMAVGVIVGSAFTAIVNALSNSILKPLINWLLSFILSSNGLEGAVTILSPGYNAEGVLDLALSIYIDWGAFISAIINFFIVAFALFSIVKIINKITEAREKMIADINWDDEKEIAKIRMEQKVSKKKAKKILLAKKEEEAKRLAEEAAVQQKKEEEEAARKAAEAEEKAMANTRLLEEIRDLLKQKM